jgi:hypothetical protein
MLLWRGVARLVGMLWMLALALLGLGVALYCLDGLVRLGSVRPDRLMHLAGARRHVGHFLAQLASPGPTAALALLCGVGAMALGVLLLVGLLRSRRPYLARLDGGADAGRLAARPSALRDISRALAERAPGATAITHPKLRLARRRRRGRLGVTASHAATSDPASVQRAVTESLAPISGPFALTPRVRVRRGKPGERVR